MADVKETTLHPPSPPSLRVTLVVALLYGVLAKLSFLLTIPPGNITPIFPAAGLALACVMLKGRRVLPGVWLGSFVTNALSSVDGTMSPAHAGPLALVVAAFIGFGAAAGASAGAFLVGRLCGNKSPLHSGPGVLILVTFGALGCCLISPTVGVTSLALAGSVPWQHFGYSWVTWWVGDASGSLVIAPLILAWYQKGWSRNDVWRVLEAAALGTTTILACLVVSQHTRPFQYMLLPLVFWAAFRFGMRGAATTSSVIALFAVIGTSRGTSPFVGTTVNESLLLLNLFLGVTMTCALFMAGVLEDQKRAEQELHKVNQAMLENEETLRLLGDNLPDSYVYQYTLKPNGTPQFLHLSAGVEQLHGIQSKDILQDASLLHRQIAPEMIPAFQAAESASIRDLTDFNMELRMHRADGEWRWMQVCSRPRRTADGQVLWDGVVTDITRRKQAEDAIQQSEERLRLITENLTDLVAVLDLEGRRLYNSPSYRTILGEPEALWGSCSFEQIHPEDQDRVRDSFQQTVRTGIGQRLEYRLMDFRGRVRHIESQGSVIRDEQGRVAKVLVVSRDVTERQHAEEARRESERKYRELVELANSIILRWNAEGCITFLNDFGLRFFGYSAEEIFGRHVMGTIVPRAESSGRDLQQLMEKICADPAAYEQNTNENMRRSGERVWISWTNRIVRDADGRVLEILSVGTDVTARRKAEEQIHSLNQALRRHTEELEHRVAERTVQLAEARDRAEAADRIKSAFLASMSHELRTPLNSIIGFTGILLQGLAGPLNSEQTKQLEMVRASARHLLALINDVLDISKIEAGQLQVACEPFDMCASVSKVVGIVRPLAEKKGLALHVQLHPALGRIVSDPRRVEQILLNLLNNAIKFTERGEVNLQTIVLQDSLRISIADTGMGIKPEDLATLFQPFRQIDTGLSRNHEGTGLGLAICRRLAGLLGGEIHAESHWEQGSVFTLTLPRR
jgi:PAS domain S-box-containing protein